VKSFRSRYVRRVLVPVMAVSVLSACSTWKVQDMAPSQVVAEKEPGQVLLTMLDGGQILLADPTVSEGEIVGHPVRNPGGNYRVIRSDTLRVPTDSVARIGILETDALATGAGVMIGLVAAGFVVGTIFLIRGLENW
jgi:hypothetical protein